MYVFFSHYFKNIHVYLYIIDTEYQIGLNSLKQISILEVGK